MKHIYTKATCTIEGKTYTAVDLCVADNADYVDKDDILFAEHEVIKVLMTKIPEYRYAK